MGVYIKGIEMPDNCYSCQLCVQNMDSEHNVYNTCAALGKDILPLIAERQEDCPLVEVPPHGRLIDADALFKEIGINSLDCYKCNIGNNGFCRMGSEFTFWCEKLEDAPTIIEAEEET